MLVGPFDGNEADCSWEEALQSWYVAVRNHGKTLPFGSYLGEIRTSSWNYRP